MSHLLIGLTGLELSAKERQWLQRDDVGGVVLFARNISGAAQISRLNDAIRAVDADALIAIDQEGGRIQRIQAPCTVLPPLAAIGRCWESDVDQALELAFAHAQLMASEMIALGIDLSFAPVLDLDAGSTVIGDRAFHRDPDVVKELGRIYVKGMHNVGMAACGKHFPGHGSVTPDTHNAPACDERPIQQIARCDLKPFQVAVMNGLDAVMMAHVSYPDLDDQPAGYSQPWVRFLRDRMRFGGVIISDDLGMAAACAAGNLAERLSTTLRAGCDVALVCMPDDVAELFAGDRLPTPERDVRSDLHRRQTGTWDDFAISPERQEWQQTINQLT